MNWLYFIPHVWDSPDDRTIWEDVYILPLFPRSGDDGSSVWLTVYALGPRPDSRDRLELDHYARCRRKLHGRDYMIDRPICNMYVRTLDFNLAELLFYAEFFIFDSFGDPDPRLVPGRREDFAGTNAHARIVAAIVGKVATEGENYRN